MTTLKVAVVRATNLCVGMFLDLAALFPAPRTGWVVWPFEFHPVDPDGGRNSVAVLFLGGIKSSKERVHFSAVGLFLLHGKFARGFRPHLDGDLDDLRLFNGSGNLVRTDLSLFQTPVQIKPLPLRVTGLDKMAGGIGTFHCTGAHPQGIAPLGQLLWGNDDASGSLGGFQVCSRVPMRQVRVMFVVRDIVGRAIRVVGRSIWGVYKAEIAGIGSALESVGISIEENGMLDSTFCFGDLSDDRLILRCRRSSINAFLPLGETLVSIFDSFDKCFILRVDGFLRLNAVSLEFD